MAHRRTALAMIHIAAKQFGWTETEYRDHLFSVCRVRSAADLDAHGREQFIAHLKALGWKPKPGRTPKTRGRPRNLDRSAMMRKIEALLADAGRPWHYADELAAKLTKPKKERIAFCNDNDLHKVVVALELDARRRLVRAIEPLLDYLGLAWCDAVRMAREHAGLKPTQDLSKNPEAMSTVRARLNTMAQEACDL